MPLLIKLLFLAVALGLALWVGMAFRHGQVSQPRNRIEPIGTRRYRRLWVVDEEPLDKHTER
jgi:hypothetical protein